ncbi:hypothetical protein JL720_10748 [Aureococcus anophagefferens]|nr:hypothetical protein JL720_10748 [Aureococcus anophagefferens]
MLRRLRFAALAAAAACPLGLLNEEVCSGHGHCAEGVAPGVDETCACDGGYGGADCSLRICPAGVAWSDYATANNTAHAAHFECSNMGSCDRESGLCECRSGFAGEACQRMRCPHGARLAGGAPLECFGVGTCLSMAEAAAQVDYVSLEHDAADDGWDVHDLRLRCDAGFAGYDCSERECPGATTPHGGPHGAHPADATAELLEFHLERLSTLGDVDVAYYGGGLDGSLCSDAGTTAAITFLTTRGDLPALNATWAIEGTTYGPGRRADVRLAVDGAGVGVCDADKFCNCTAGYEGSARVQAARRAAWWGGPSATTRDAHRPGATCSNKGLCDRSSGNCDCDDDFGRRAATLRRRHGLRASPGTRTATGCKCHASTSDYPTHDFGADPVNQLQYRGPFAYTYTGWTGYQCSHAFCPTGDNPYTSTRSRRSTAPRDRRRLQRHVPRRAEPVRVPWWASGGARGEARGAPTIRDVAVSLRNVSYNASVCGPGQRVYVEFLSEHGDLPLLVVSEADDLRHDAVANVTEVTKGTKEDVECSANGICNREIGICACLDGFASGADDGEPSAPTASGDCGFRHTGTKNEVGELRNAACVQIKSSTRL